MDIGRNIKEMRKERNLSQEMLAERLGVSFQAVSRWERGESYPDIGMLPAIAHFFGVTVDEILGVSSINEANEIAEIISEIRECDMHYQGEKMCELVEMSLKRYPGSYELMSWYVYAFQRVNPSKAIEVGNYVLDNCVDEEIRKFVNASIIYAYKNNGQREIAIERAKKLPHYFQSSCDVLRSCLEGKEQLNHVQHMMIDLAYEFWYSIRQISNNYTVAEQIELFRKSNDIYDAIYETDDMPIKLARKMRNYQGMAEVSLSAGNVDDALDYMKSAVECAVKHDKLPEMVESKAILFNVHPYNRNCEATMNLCKELLNDFETEDEFYKDIREKQEYRELKQILVTI